MPKQLLVPIKRLDETLEVPRYAYEGDAGVDLRAAEDFSLKPFERKLVPTGIAIARREAMQASLCRGAGLL